MDWIEKKQEQLSKRRYGGNRTAVLIRDGYKCSFCNSTNYLCVHHKDKNLKNNSLENLITLCQSCHTKIHMTTRHNVTIERDIEIFNKRLNGETLQKIGNDYKISRERVRQIMVKLAKTNI